MKMGIVMIIFYGSFFFISESVSYEFSGRGGVITYSYPRDKQPDTKVIIIIIVIFGVTPIILFEYFNDIVRTKRQSQQMDLQSVHPLLLYLNVNQLITDSLTNEHSKL